MGKEIVELSEEEKREIFKKLKKYEVSKNWKDIIKKYEKLATESIVDIDDILEDREIAEVIYSELDLLNIYIDVFKDVVEKIDDSEAGKLFKMHINEQIANAKTHIYDKVEVGYDSPIYSYLDTIKTRRNIYKNMYKKLDEIATFYSKIEDKVDNSNPYEEVK